MNPFFTHLNRVINRSRKNNLQVEDFPTLDPMYDAKDNALRITAARTAKRSLFSASLKAHSFNFYVLCPILKIFNDCFLFISPIMIRYYTSWLQSEDKANLWKGYVYAICMALGLVFKSIFDHAYLQMATRQNAMSKGGITYLMYRHILSLHPSKLPAPGYLSTLLNNDVRKACFSIQLVHLLWSSPLQIIGGLIMCGIEVGTWPTIGALCVMLLTIPLQYFLNNKRVIYLKERFNLTDKRTQEVQELLNNAELLKKCGLEQEIANVIGIKRKDEMKVVRRVLKFSLLMDSLRELTPAFVTLAVFLISGYVNRSKSFEARAAGSTFATLAILASLTFPLRGYPNIVSNFLEGRISWKRLQEFLDTKNDSSYVENVSNVDLSINGTFSYTNDGQAVISVDDLSFQTGKLTMIAGPIKSGKSSLLQALTGNLVSSNGQVKNPFKKIATVHQSPVIINDTVRGNIVFGMPYVEERYLQVIRACGLESDFGELVNGDLTEVGERGTTLSGGQAARVALGRALYSDADCLLFDDVLSALDANVSAKVFHDAITGIAADRTVIFASHQVQFASHVDKLIYLEDGIIKAQGGFDEVASICPSFEAYRDVPIECSSCNRIASTDFIGLDKPTTNPTYNNVSTVKLVKEESKRSGAVGFSTFKFYFRHAPQWTIYLGLFFVICARISLVMTDYWLAWWDAERYALAPHIYPLVYLGITLAGVLFTLLLSYCILILSVDASKHLHDSMLGALLHSSYQWFASTPIGIALTRFSKDITEMDVTFIVTLNTLCFVFTQMLGAIIVICIASAWLILSVPVFGLAFWYFASGYRAGVRETNRFSNMSNTPLQSAQTEAITALTTLQSYHRVEDLSNTFVGRMNTQNNYYWVNMQLNRWIGLRQEILAAFVVLTIAFIGIWTGKDSTAYAAIMALAVSKGVSLSFSFMLLIRQLAEFEMSANSLERIEDFSKSVDDEGAWTLSNSQNWPTRGAITFKNFTCKYREDLPEVLKNVSLEIQPKTKVAFVGRTAAGKSTMISAILRAIPITSGQVLIDGIDIEEAGLHDLRRGISFVPQRVALFSGPLFKSLDPTGVYSKQDILRATQKLGVYDIINSLPNGFDTELEIGGSNLSAGTKQVVMLVRAFLNNSPILLLDEASSNVDAATDEIMQAAIRANFSNSTIVCIAHRINTIIDYDRIVVFDHGRVVEDGSPKELFAQGGVFASLCQHAGVEA